MKRIILGLIVLLSVGFAKEPVNWGIVKGNAKIYFPHIKVQNSYIVQNSATTGIKDGLPTRLNDTSFELLESFQITAKKSCKKNYGYLLDNVNSKYQTFGDYNNILVFVSANVVCFDL